MIKLKNILSEAYAWERQAGKSLPTLAEVQAAYQAKMREDANLDPEDDDHEYTDDADLPEPYDPDEDDMFESAKPDFLDLDNDNNKTEPMKKAAADSTADGNYVNKSRAKAHLTKKDCTVYGIDGSGKGHEITSASGLDKYTKFTVKSKSVKESLNSRILNNLRGSEYILSETFKK